MSEKYKNKYRIDSTRLKNWNYKWNAAYFITICTKDRICFFGNVVDDKMVLNDIGKIAENIYNAAGYEFVNGQLCSNAQSFSRYFHHWGTSI